MSWDNFVEDIEVLAEELYKCPDTEQTASSLHGVLTFFKCSWRKERQISTTGNGIPIPPPRKKGISPRTSSVLGSSMNFFFCLGDDFDSMAIPLHSDFQVKTEGVLEFEHCVVQLEDHWRVDSHNFKGQVGVNGSEEGDSEASPPKEPHPYIHFQRGGHAQDSFSSQHFFVPGESLPKKQDDYWKGLMQAPGPRIPFLPHCPILAIDYVIGQHDGEVWSFLRRSPGYRAVVKKSQARLWDPFFAALSRQEVREKWVGPVFL